VIEHFLWYNDLRAYQKQSLKRVVCQSLFLLDLVAETIKVFPD
jgi:hypothetical protein